MAAIDDLKKILDEISSDIDDLQSKLPAEGGMTAAEVEEFKSALSAVAAKHTPESSEGAEV